MPTFIDMFTCNTCGDVYDRYKELKQQEMAWEQLLTEVTVIDDEKVFWDSIKQKKHKMVFVVPPLLMGESLLKPAIRRRRVLLECAEEFYQKRILNRRNTKGVFEKDFAFIVVRSVTILVTVRLIPLPDCEKVVRFKFS